MRTAGMCTGAFVAVCLALSAAASEPESVRRAKAKVAKGEKQLAAESFRDAESLFRKAIVIEPALPSAHLGLGAALVGQRRYREAIRALAEAERRYTDFDEMNRQSMATMKSSIESTRRQVETIEDAYGVFHQIPAWQGLNQDQIGKLNPEQVSSMPAQAYYLQGIAFLRTHQNEAGIERLRRCLQIEPRHGLANYNLAVALLAEGSLDDARRHLEIALAEDVDAPPNLVEKLNPHPDQMARFD